MSAAAIDETPAAGTYDDWPGCLLRYAWLIETSDGRDLYTGRDERARCKACGKLTPPAEQREHLREERRQLARVRKQTAQARRRENTARLRTLNRLRKETR